MSARRSRRGRGEVGAGRGVPLLLVEGSGPVLVHSGASTRKLSYCKDDCAMRTMYGRPENFQESLTTPTATFPEFLMTFCSD